MKKSIWAGLLVLLVVCVGLWIIGKRPDEPSLSVRPSDKLKVAVSGYVAYALAREIGADKVDLMMLVPPGTEPHHFEPTPGAIIAVDKSDLFIYVSDRVEPWTQDILRGLGHVVSLASGPTEEEDDPHVWMTPYGALSMAKRMAEAFSHADPANKVYYKNNLKSFETQIEQLHAAFTTGLKNCQSYDIVHMGHLAFGSLAHAYGLNLQALTGTSHQGEHSVRRLTDLVQFIRRNRVPAVFTEELISPELARTVAEETGVRVLPLYTVEEVSKQDFDRGITYGEYMRRNLKNLQEGLVCAV